VEGLLRDRKRTTILERTSVKKVPALHMRELAKKKKDHFTGKCNPKLRVVA